MEFLNSFVYVDTTAGEAGLTALFVILAAITLGLCIANFFVAVHKQNFTRYIIALAFFIAFGFNVRGVVHFYNSTPLIQRHEVLWRDTTQPFMIDPQQHMLVDQRGCIYVIQEIDPICTRGEYEQTTER